MKNYIRFGLMILTSTVGMYFLMYFNILEIDHFWYSESKLYMALFMGAWMAVVMLLFMWKMYENKKVNYAILGTAVLVFSLGLYLERSQTTVQDVNYMKAMIPHHSIAILTSTRAEIRDPEVRALADEIIKAQREEIAIMTQYIEELEDDDEEELQPLDELRGN
ncbi:protein of unknown function [Alkalibacterium subtropicum]|uniref:DUF305 domain-containing protein n=1 Tax=Alkalibacterium subtropicum TaxID=753702 RepID=A0A1I1G340_9LACT|nr:DUF305 domain-containing protein [Alkalibacterium subtropicum]SFC03610.1 protein of unknown function [Alkalibacterium subtropicum]